MAQTSRKLENHCSLETPSKQITAKIIQRRSANYEPSVKWDFQSLQSLKSEYMRETYEEQANKLKESVKHTFNDEEMTSLAWLELIDAMEKLGLGYLFENEIKRTLDNIFTMNKIPFETAQEDLYAISLRFRLLRQHGYEVSQDVFVCFMKDIQIGNWKPNINDENVKGMLSLYEASYLALEGETILDEAKTFTTKYLHDIIDIENNCLSSELVKQVKHSLELPLHWRMQRLKTRWYIDNITLAEDTIYSDLLHLAKLDFNMVQATHQNDLREMSSWWKDLGLGSELKFARDKLMEYFLWSVGMIGEPRFGNCRKGLAKAAALVTTVDDVYDVYGTLDELKVFTSVIERWDVNAMEQLPNYMKICFLALYNTINGIAYDVLKEQHLDIIRYLKKAWADLCNAYLVEAKWYYNKYTPTFEEYLNNASISIGGPLILVHAYFLINQEISEEELEYLESSTDLIQCSSTIFRLCNDLGTSKQDETKIGDVPKSIQCYMSDNNVSKDVAHEHIRYMIGETWKKMNKYLKPNSSPFSKLFIEIAANLVRVSNFMYQYRNGYIVLDLETNKQVWELLVDPISLQGQGPGSNQ